MKMADALQVMADVAEPKGFMVHFERLEASILSSDHFPDKHGGESLIACEERAWTLAEKFAAQTFGKCVNVYVIDDQFRPVADYSRRFIRNRE